MWWFWCVLGDFKDLETDDFDNFGDFDHRHFDDFEDRHFNDFEDGSLDDWWLWGLWSKVEETYSKFLSKIYNFGPMCTTRQFWPTGFWSKSWVIMTNINIPIVFRHFLCCHHRSEYLETLFKYTLGTSTSLQQSKLKLNAWLRNH